MKKKKQSPSKIKYDKSHPVVSVRVTQTLFNQLKELKDLSGKSLGDILREGLKQQTPSVKNAYQRGYQAGKVRYAVNYKCSVCGGNIVVGSENEKKEIAGYMRGDGWGHEDCIR